jgi:hypothetical protein
MRFFPAYFILLIKILFLVIGVVNFVAIYDFFREYLAWWIIFSIVFGIIVSYLPIIGNVCGFFVMTNLWGYSFLKAFLISFFNIWLVFLIFIFILIITLTIKKQNK